MFTPTGRFDVRCDDCHSGPFPAISLELHVVWKSTPCTPLNPPVTRNPLEVFPSRVLD